MQSPDNSVVRVRTLLCHRDVPLMLDGWRTLVACSADEFETVVHDDGTLTEEDMARIRGTIPGSRVLGRAEADAVMRERLASHAHARAFRVASVWGLKLLDVVLAEDGDCYYLDGDVRFFRRFHGLFHREALAGRCVFLRDPVWTAYSVRPWHLFGPRRLRLVQGINSGLTLFDRALYDLDFVDWFLAQPDWRVIPAWTESTCWAALAARANGHAVAPEQIVNLYPGATLGPATVGAHFLSSYRSRFDALVRPPHLAPAPVEIRQVPLQRLGAAELGWNQLRRKVGNELERRRHPPA